MSAYKLIDLSIHIGTGLSVLIFCLCFDYVSKLYFKNKVQVILNYSKLPASPTEFPKFPQSSAFADPENMILKTVKD